MAEMQQGVFYLRGVFETTRGNYAQTEQYLHQMAKNLGKSLRNANLSVRLYDGDEHPLSTVTDGDPSEAMKQLMEYVFNDDYEDDDEDEKAKAG